MVGKILLCTVGGAYQPIVHTLNQLQPDLTVFICSHGESSSESMINGKGKVIKENKSDEKATLPNIPTQVGLEKNSYAVETVEPDNLDQVVKKLHERINYLQKEYPQASIYADYTGGTKTMTAGLILVALDYDIKIHLVKGARDNLEKVSNGTQWMFPASVDWVKFNKTLRSHLSSWEQFAYGQTVEGLKNLHLPADNTIQNNFLMAKNLSQAFDAWDRFDHATAKSLLTKYRSKTASDYVPYFKILDILCSENNKAREPALIFDLWLNAQRRASQGRYDDAVARIYRIIEWIAQWILYSECGVSTSDIPENFIPENVDLRKDKDGRYRAPLYYAWELVKYKAKGPIATFIQNNPKGLITFLDLRNNSILAHGREPVTKAKWKEIKAWFEENILPPFKEEMKIAGLKKEPVQLPNEYKWI